MTLTLLKSTDQVFYRMFFSLSLSVVFCIFGQNTTEVMRPFDASKQGCVMLIHLITSDVNLIHLVRVMLLNFSPVKLLIFPL